MRTYDVPYVQNPAPPTYHLPLEEMSLQEIAKIYLKTCAKSGGKLSNCSHCKTKCQYGIRALDLFYNKAFVGEPIDPAKTILARKAAEEKKAEEDTVKPKAKAGGPKDKVKASEEWYRAAMKSGNPVEYTVETLHLSVKQARAKIHNFKSNHKDLVEKIESEMRKEKSAKIVQAAEENIGTHKDSTVKEEPATETPVVAADDKKVDAGDALMQTMREKIELLKAQKDEYRAEIEKLEKKVKDLDDKIDALDLCMNVFGS